MTQNIYDDDEFFAGYSGLPRQTIGLAGAPEWPAVRALLPDLTDMRVVDLGCGFGWASRWMRRHGASSVLGIDVSEKMIARAQEDTSDPAISYRIADLETLVLPGSSFDLAYSSLALHYLADFPRLVSTIHRAVVPHGHFVFTVEHPIYMAARHPRWLVDEDGRKTWPVDQYSKEGERRTDWFVSGVLKHHRTMATTLNTLIAGGFAISGINEFAPTARQVEQAPALADEVERPMMLTVAAVRNGS